MFTYVFAYYLRKNNQSVIFEDNQKDVESATETLSEYLERDITQENLADIKQKVQDKYRWVIELRMKSWGKIRTIMKLVLRKVCISCNPEFRRTLFLCLNTKQYLMAFSLFPDTVTKGGESCLSMYMKAMRKIGGSILNPRIVGPIKVQFLLELYEKLQVKKWVRFWACRVKR